MSRIRRIRLSGIKNLNDEFQKTYVFKRGAQSNRDGPIDKRTLHYSRSWEQIGRLAHSAQVARQATLRGKC
jgi:hypothetical protein